MMLIWFVYVALFNFSPVDLLSKTLSRNKRSDVYIPCEEGWLLFREKCLKLGGDSSKKHGEWLLGDTECKNGGGSLVTIQSKEELDFIITFVLLNSNDEFWIGLNNRSNPTQFSWTDGSIVNFTYWDTDQPSAIESDESCAVMNLNPADDVIGHWSLYKCGRQFTYLCQKRINVRKKSHDPQFCTANEGGGWKFKNTCYHVVNEMESWDSAEQHCKDKYGGHLVTVLDVGVDLFLDYILSSTNTEFWIGVKVTDGVQQKWASGWFVTYNPSTTDVVDDPCVLRNGSEWTMASCSEKHPFICDTFRDPPVLKPPVNGSHCPEIPRGWIDLEGEYCYFFETEKLLIWPEALFECKRRGGNLVSIHSKEEADLLQPFVKYVPVNRRLWIGLLREMEREDRFIWSDGSPLDYENWISYHIFDETEKCVELWTDYMDWSDKRCSKEHGFICSVRKITPNVTETEETIEYNCTIPDNVVLIGVSVCIHLLLIVLGVGVCCFRSRRAKRREASKSSAISRNAVVAYRGQSKSVVVETHHYEEPIYDEPHYEEPVYGENKYEQPMYVETPHYEIMY